MTKTLQQLLQDSAAFLDLDPTLPTGTELDARISYAQQAVEEWASSYVWRQLRREYQPSVSTLASISLPTDFREFSGAPRVMLDNGNWRAYDEVSLEDRYTRNTSDYYCYVLYGPNGGTVIFNNLDSGASLSIAYQRQPSNMATLTDLCEVPDPNFVKTKVISYVLQSRSDNRFPVIEAEAQRLLSNMIGREMAISRASVNTVKKTGTASYSVGS